MITNYLRSLSWQTYNIGFIEGSPDDFSLDFSHAKVNWLDTNGLGGDWLADPFILSVTPQKIILLVEEYFNYRGHISRIEVERPSFKLIDVRRVLSLDSHLSFPYLIKDRDGSIFVAPENQAAGCFKIYPYSDIDASVGSPVTIIDKPLVDAQILNIDNKYYVFSIVSSRHDKFDSQHLEIFVADQLTGPYSLLQSIDSPYCDERGAGTIFRYRDAWIRPTQLSDKSYGEATIFKRLFRTPDGLFHQENISSLYPQKNSKYPLCLHTFNSVGDITVVDGLKYKYPFFIKFIKPFINKIRQNNPL